MAMYLFILLGFISMLVGGALLYDLIAVHTHTAIQIFLRVGGIFGWLYAYYYFLKSAKRIREQQ